MIDHNKLLNEYRSTCKYRASLQVKGVVFDIYFNFDDSSNKDKVADDYGVFFGGHCFNEIINEAVVDAIDAIFDQGLTYVTLEKIND